MRGDGKRLIPLARNLRKSMTKAERILWSRLKNRGLHGWKFRRQRPMGPYIVDFICLEGGLIVEVDGATHSTDEEKARDAQRDRYTVEQGFSTIRIPNREIYENLEGVCQTILGALPPSGPTDHLPRKRGRDM